MTIFRNLIRSAAFYPFTAFYVGAVLIVLAVSEQFNWLEPLVGVILMGFWALGLLIVAALRELHNLHILYRSGEEQRQELLTRVEELLENVADLESQLAEKRVDDDAVKAFPRD